MTDHHRAAQLAAAALDFDLTVEEHSELERHRADCGMCRQITDDFRTDAAALQGLPRFDARAQLRQVVAEAAWHQAVPGRSRTGLILLVAALLMLAMAIGGALAAGEWLERDNDSMRPTRTLDAPVVRHLTEIAMEGATVCPFDMYVAAVHEALASASGPLTATCSSATVSAYRRS